MKKRFLFSLMAGAALTVSAEEPEAAPSVYLQDHSP